MVTDQQVARKRAVLPVRDTTLRDRRQRATSSYLAQTGSTFSSTVVELVLCEDSSHLVVARGPGGARVGGAGGKVPQHEGVHLR